MASDSDDTKDDDRGGDGGDLDRLARRYLDVWQSQLSGLAADPAVTEQIARLFAAANSQMATAMQAAQGAPNASFFSAPAAGAASAAAAPGNGPDDVGELRKRVAALEARLVELESRLPRA